MKPFTLGFFLLVLFINSPVVWGEENLVKISTFSSEFKISYGIAPPWSTFFHSDRERVNPRLRYQIRSIELQRDMFEKDEIAIQLEIDGAYYQYEWVFTGTVLSQSSFGNDVRYVYELDRSSTSVWIVFVTPDYHEQVLERETQEVIHFKKVENSLWIVEKMSKFFKEFPDEFVAISGKDSLAFIEIDLSVKYPIPAGFRMDCYGSGDACAEDELYSHWIMSLNTITGEKKKVAKLTGCSTHLKIEDGKLIGEGHVWGFRKIKPKCEYDGETWNEKSEGIPMNLKQFISTLPLKVTLPLSNL